MVEYDVNTSKVKEHAWLETSQQGEDALKHMALTQTQALLSQTRSLDMQRCGTHTTLTGEPDGSGRAEDDDCVGEGSWQQKHRGRQGKRQKRQN